MKVRQIVNSKQQKSCPIIWRPFKDDFCSCFMKILLSEEIKNDKFAEKNCEMATDQLLLQEFNKLPASLQQEVLDFVGYLSSKYKTKRTTPKRKAGSMKGLVSYMADDFNAPLEDFKDYM